MNWTSAKWRAFQIPILVMLASSVLLFLISVILTHSFAFDYLLWNLVLATTPLILALWLSNLIKLKLWSSWGAIGLSVLWLLFLPNSFYMISDLIHLSLVSGEFFLLYNTVAFTSMVFSAVVMGCISLYLVHRELVKRLEGYQAAILVALAILSCSLAIYIGRELRWNSWDVITNPGGLIYDLDIHVLHTFSQPQIVYVTTMFFVLIATLYLVTWRAIKYLKSTNHESKSDLSY